MQYTKHCSCEFVQIIDLSLYGQDICQSWRADGNPYRLNSKLPE